MANKTQVSINFGAPLFMILLILKLTETVSWSWWIITLPLWFPFAVIGTIAGVAFMFALIASLIK
jgi:hypothetical protein